MAPLALLTVLSVLIAACGEPADESAAGQQRPPPPVEIAQPLFKTIVEWDEFTGRFEAVDRVELRARVSGYLEEIHFRDGQLVEEGDPLFTIDPRPFVAALEGAQAQIALAQARVKLEFARKQRGERLLGTNAISQEEVDERRAAYAEALAELAAAEAAVRSRELDVEFTRIVSPIRGRISDRKVDVGNLISGGTDQATLLATVVALDPIHFVFDASEADYLRYVRLQRAGTRPSSREADNPVYVKLMDETEWVRRGRMDFVDNTLDDSAGTIRGRAIFDNPDMFLAPGIFGRLRLLGSGEYEAILVPDGAVLSDQSTKLVYVVDGEGMVAARRVELGPIHEGMRIIRSGLDADDWVIVNGVQRARPGGAVTPQKRTLGGSPESDQAAVSGD